MFDFAEKRMDLGLNRMFKAMNYLSNPQDNYDVILIAGTNGKGSTTTYLSTILKEAGYKVGSFYSPHLVKWNERIRLNGEKISNERAYSYLDDLKNLVSKFNLTYFEVLTSLAYIYFYDEKVDFAVMEVGLGGRWDATNIAKEKLSIITKISLDHSKILGENEKKIAFEKSGIIKNSDVIFNNIPEVFDKKARAINKHSYKLGRDFNINNFLIEKNLNNFDYSDPNISLSLSSHLIGYHQAENASEAVKTSLLLGISQDSIKKGIYKSKISARFEIMSTNPLTIIDSAHNPNGSLSLKNSLNAMFPNKKILLIFGAMKDKDWRSMLNILNPYKLIAVEVENSRSEKAENISAFFKPSIVIKDIVKAYEYALQNANQDYIIVITGSIYVIGELYKRNKFKVY